MKNLILKGAIVAVAVAVLGLAFGQASSISKLEGKKMPNISMTDLAGKKHTNESLKGKVVLLDFWASWCGPCKAASPFMQSFHKKYASKGLVVIGANFEGQVETKNVTSRYSKKHNLTYTFTHNNNKVAEVLGVTGLPSFIFVDRKGVVRRTEAGFAPSMVAKMDAKIQKLLAEK